MRPRKRILLYCEDEQRASELAFVVNNCYDLKVAKCESVEQFRHMLPQISWELVVVVYEASIERTEDICLRARRGADCPVLVLRWPVRVYMPVLASLALPGTVSMEGVLDAMRNLSKRHRGPKKGTKRVQPVAVVLQISA